ncbi:MAG TPA: GNAT family N-acetyltransferase [Methylomirabilota bacterium]|jgi:GNAT superfamily N-acetyltransferase|nr:GNAT family N-acetyltransferase [Methylomirabilota bacterium]
MRELSTRDARATDRDAIRDVTLAAYQEYAARMASLWDSYRQNILATLAAVAPAEQIVAEQDGSVVGCVLLYPPRHVRWTEDEPAVWIPWPEVRLLAVAPGARGRGVGAALMQECVGRARRSGVAALSLHTTDLMQAAMQLYARMGFVRAPELDFSPAPGVTVKGYRLDLRAP